MSGGAFTRRSAAVLAALGGASLVAAGFLGTYGDVLYDPPSWGADSFSRSAVGHRAFVELLRGLGIPVLVSRHGTAVRAWEGAPVALIEPRLGPEEGGPRRAILDDILGQEGTLLVVLPKREAFPDPLRPRWAASAPLLPLDDAQRVAEAILPGAKVVRPPRPAGAWRGDLPAPQLDEPQLVVSADIVPLVANDAGVLAGELETEEGGRIVVLADPDVLATHGLSRGENAVLATRLVERIVDGDVPIALDETLHGFDRQPSVARELLRFPLILATLSALAVAALLAWGALVRFGRPRRPEPALAPGKLFLVESSAALLRHGGHVPHAAAAYLRAAKEEVLRGLRRAGGGGDPGRLLESAAEARGRAAALRALEARVTRLEGRRSGVEEEAVRTAQAIHEWREEMSDGAHGDPRRHRAAQG